MEISATGLSFGYLNYSHKILIILHDSNKFSSFEIRLTKVEAN